MYTSANYMPDYLAEVKGYSTSKADSVTSYLYFAMLAGPFIGYVIDRTGRRLTVQLIAIAIATACFVFMFLDVSCGRWCGCG